MIVCKGFVGLLQNQVNVAFYALSPEQAVRLQPSIVHVRALAVVLTVGMRQAVRVGSFERKSMFPQTSLCLSDWGAGAIPRCVIGGLSNEPRDVPPGLCTRREDDTFEHAAIGFGGDVMLQRLVRIRFSLVPEDCAEPVWTKLLDPRHHSCEEGSIAGKTPICCTNYEPRHRGHHLNGIARR